MNWLSAFVWPVGRLSRLGFWLASITLIALYVPIVYASSLVFGSAEAPHPLQGAVTWGVPLLLLWSFLCIRIRRLHDFDGTGFWVLLPLIPSALAAAAAPVLMFGGVEWSGWLFVSPLFIFLIFDLAIGFRRSTDASGEPRGRPDAAAAFD